MPDTRGCRAVGGTTDGQGEAAGIRREGEREQAKVCERADTTRLGSIKGQVLFFTCSHQRPQDIPAEASAWICTLKREGGCGTKRRPRVLLPGAWL